MYYNTSNYTLWRTSDPAKAVNYASRLAVTYNTILSMQTLALTLFGSNCMNSQGCLRNTYNPPLEAPTMMKFWDTSKQVYWKSELFKKKPKKYWSDRLSTNFNPLSGFQRWTEYIINVDSTQQQNLIGQIVDNFQNGHRPSSDVWITAKHQQNVTIGLSTVFFSKT